MNFLSNKNQLSSRFDLLIIFVLALIVRLWFNLSVDRTREAFAFDASEYLRLAQAFNQVLSSDPSILVKSLSAYLGLSTLNEIQQIKQALSPLQGLVVSGPVFPLLILLSYKIIGLSPSITTWQAPLVVQSILTAFSCVLIAMIGRICWYRNVGFIAGILSAIYPGFIVNSGRLYSESLACFFVCLVLWLVSRSVVTGQANLWFGLALGISAIALQSTRSAMMIITIAIFLIYAPLSFVFLRTKRLAIQNVAGLFMGAILIIVPWLAVQKLTLGKASLMVDRNGAYNVFIGSNSDTLGWLSFPYPEAKNIEQKKFSELIVEAIQKSPERWLKLMLDKPPRLFKNPWNDLRTPIGPFALTSQIDLHQWILLLAAIGVVLGFFKEPQQHTERRSITARFLVLAAFFGHLIYVPFIAMARYALTAMPAVLLFAAVGLVNIAKSLAKDDGRKVSTILVVTLIIFFVVIRADMIPLMMRYLHPLSIHICLVLEILLKLLIGVILLFACLQVVNKSYRGKKSSYAIATAMLLIALPYLCLPLRAYGRWYEWSKDFNQVCDSREEVIFIPERVAQHDKRQLFLAINIQGGAQFADDFRCLVNGIELHGPFVPSMALAQDFTLVKVSSDNSLSLEMESILNEITAFSNLNNLDLRQWYFVPITEEQWKQVIGTAEHKSSRDVCSILCLHAVITKKKESNGIIFGNFQTNKAFSLIPSFSRFSWEKAYCGVESGIPFNDPAYDLKVIHIPVDKMNEHAYIRLLKVSPYTVVPRMHLICEKRLPTLVIKSGSSVVNNIVVSPELSKVNAKSEYGETSLWLVRLSGKISKTSLKSIYPSLELCGSKSGRQFLYHSCWLPDQIKLTSQQNAEIDYSFPIYPQAWPGPLSSILIHFKGGPSATLGKSSMSPGPSCLDGQALLDSLKLEIYEMPRLNSDAAFEVY